jgi:hypothetical protein
LVSKYNISWVNIFKFNCYLISICPSVVKIIRYISSLFHWMGFLSGRQPSILTFTSYCKVSFVTIAGWIVWYQLCFPWMMLLCRIFFIHIILKYRIKIILLISERITENSWFCPKIIFSIHCLIQDKNSYSLWFLTSFFVCWLLTYGCLFILHRMVMYFCLSVLLKIKCSFPGSTSCVCSYFIFFNVISPMDNHCLLFAS